MHNFVDFTLRNIGQNCSNSLTDGFHFQSAVAYITESVTGIRLYGIMYAQGEFLVLIQIIIQRPFPFRIELRRVFHTCCRTSLFELFNKFFYQLFVLQLSIVLLLQQLIQ